MSWFKSVFMPEKAHAERQQRIHWRVKTRIDQHADALVARKAQLVYSDPYGNLVRHQWDAEIAYFIEHVIMHQFSTDDLYDLLPYANFQILTPAALLEPDGPLVRLVESVVAEHERKRPTRDAGVDIDFAKMTPLAFEAECVALLQKAGWNATLTKPTGDQGVDIIAKLNGVSIVAQCKRYTRPVGNKAVQEVIAAMAYEGADHAIVISNKPYTTAAKQLAAKAGVQLIHPIDIRRLAALLRISERKVPKRGRARDTRS